MRKKSDKQKAKALAWKAFSLFIRLKYTDEKCMAKCITCDSVLHYSKLQAGHGIGGRTAGILFEEKCVRPQCMGCNKYRAGAYADYHKWMIEKYSLEGFYALIRQREGAKAWTEEEYEAGRETWLRACYKMAIEKDIGDLVLEKILAKIPKKWQQ